MIYFGLGIFLAYMVVALLLYRVSASHSTKDCETCADTAESDDAVIVAVLWPILLLMVWIDAVILRVKGWKS